MLDMFKFDISKPSNCERCKVDVPIFISILRWTHVFESCMVGCGPQIDMCCKKIELCAQNLLTILDAIVKIFGRTYVIIK
jgi:hypothetical protein